MESLSIEQINKLQEENEAYKQSEQEASEIIAELKLKNKTLIKTINKLMNERVKTKCYICKAALAEIQEYIANVTYNHTDSFITYEELLNTVYEIQSVINEVL